MQKIAYQDVLGESFLHVEGERDIFRHSAQKSHTVVNSNLENIFLILIMMKKLDRHICYRHKRQILLKEGITEEY